MAFRRRKPRVFWFRTFNADNVGTETATCGLHGNVAVAAAAFSGAAASATAIYPIVNDREDVGATDTFNQQQTWSYRLRRIIGKCFVSMRQTAGSTYTQGAWVTAGFIILRTDPITGNPIAGATPEVYSPARLEGIQDPWIWRRTWLLSNGSSTSATQYGFYPYTNAEYGSIQDGPHIDQKTARRVSQEERLFFLISTLPTNNAALGGTVDFFLDYRVLASLTPSTGNRRNASR